MAEEAADTVEIPMPAIPAARAIPARHITTALTIVPDRLHPAPAADQAHRRLRILVRLVRRHPVRRRQAPVRLPRTRPRALLRTPAAARLPDQVTAHRPDQVTARRHNPPRPRIQAAGRHNRLFHPTSSRSFGLLESSTHESLAAALFYTALRAKRSHPGTETTRA